MVRSALPGAFGICGHTKAKKCGIEAVVSLTAEHRPDGLVVDPEVGRQLTERSSLGR